MRKTPAIAIALVLNAAPAAPAGAETVICAVPPAYAALEAVRDLAPEPFTARYAPADELYAAWGNDRARCDLLVSGDERLPVLLTRAGKLAAGSMHAFVRAPLVLWSADPKLLDARGPAGSRRPLTSLALPDPRLTPAGYAARLVTSRPGFPSPESSLRLYRVEQEFQAYALVSDGHAAAGFMTKPLIVREHGRVPGSYWQVPRRDYPDINYYVSRAASPSSPAVETLYRFICSNKKVLEAFCAAGFAPLTDPEDRGR